MPRTVARSGSPQPLIADVSLGVLGVALLACALAFASWGIPPLPPAPSLALGVPSPLTGMTRSFVAVAQGDLIGALALHPLGPACVAACAVAAANLAVVVTRGRRASGLQRLLRGRFGLVVGIAFALVWIRQIAVFG